MSDVNSTPWLQDQKGRFLSGNIGGGRPKGSRNKLAEALIEDLLHDWKGHGIQAIEACRESDPGAYLKIIALVVRQAEDFKVDEDMRDAAVEAFIEERRQRALLQIERMKAE